MKVRVMIFGMGLSVLGNVSVLAQEVPFIWGHSWGVGARALGMAGAYTGVAEDYSALYYNPAGLGQLQGIEVFGSFSHLSLSDRATFMGEETSESSSFTKLNSIGLVVPVPTYRGSLVFGVGYHRVRDFDGVLHVTKFISTPGDSVTWEYNELEQGGLGNLSFGGSMEAAPGLFVGAAVNFWTGEDDWTWRFTETDEPYDIWEFSEFISTTYIHTEFSGVNFTLGTLFQLDDAFRFGGVIVTPVTLTCKEDWDYSEVTSWDDGFRSTDTTESGYSEYKIQSPWVFRLGGSLKSGPLLVSADVEFKDYSQIKYKTDPPVEGYSMADMNLEIKSNFQNTINYRVGGEFEVPGVGVKLRAGYGLVTSPFKRVSSGQDRKILALGAGFPLTEEFTLDVGYASTSWDGVVGGVIEKEKIETKKVLVTVSYRL